MNEEYRQISLFRDLTENFKIDKPIRLIELFAGIGSQAMALRDLGADFVSWRAVEIDRFAMESYNAIHGTDYEVSDIKNIHAADLGIVERGRYCYLMTYSFPCQDLSNAGLRKGMEKGSGTRSGLLWEVERILTECGDERPQVLLMENVPAVHNRKNAADFEKWRLSLESMGYRNYWKDLNAKDYGVAQSRNRCFMVSILGDERPYIFPEPWSLDKTVADYLEDEVEEKFYIRTERARKLIAQLLDRSALPEAAFERNKACVDGTTAGGGVKEIANAVCAKDRSIVSRPNEGTAVVERSNRQYQ